ncbi:MAG TPA: FAD-linked oxidase [Desulfobacteraceae bacterium]|mgnify:CR=1 FL=1|nr:FAD-linked oxidase [Desulfobacteraceae bacterium]
MIDPKRKIPYNYTSADDDQIIDHLFGSETRHTIRSLEAKKGTGRSSRLLYRFMGDLFIIQRNAFLFQELVEHPLLRRKLFAEFVTDLAIIRENARHEEVDKVLAGCRQALEDLRRQIRSVASDQARAQRHLGPVIGKDNIYFDPFNITAHATDATDWRRYSPVAVLRPDEETQVRDLVRSIRELDFAIIPRGAGTGLTGGATPLTPQCVMINTEKLNRIFPVEKKESSDGRPYWSMGVEAGVITQDAKDAAAAQGLIFATDPTSAWACTIGGNLAENAGGKTAVLYGTALDNLLAYRIVMPDGETYSVQREDHPLRKILPEDELTFKIRDAAGELTETIRMTGNDVRKKGLGKDVTNKTLLGLPGIQKEGCDGIITWAEFILYPEFDHKRTCCIEFFGDDMTEAGQVITAICSRFTNGDPALIALEHFDEEYIKAIKYKTKQSVGDRLKAVLLIDMVSNDAASLDRGMATLESILEPYDKTGFTVAEDAAEAKRFWEDRKRLGAIAAHTNAFKLNEDIVLPIDSLADFVRFVDETNLEEKKYNQNRIIQDITDYLSTAVPLSDPQWLKKKVGLIKDAAYKAKKRLDIASREAIERALASKAFYKQTVETLRGYSLLLENVEKIYTATASRLIVIATHMHAGDGNVHVNIPVMSNDREMMERAHMAADKVMAKAVALEGVVSGEHGIGVTKFKYLDREQVEEFTAYREKVDPDGLMNPGKLAEEDILAKVFTPSFNLLDMEARILKHGSLSDLAMKIANCVRCGKCKPQCPVFYPAKNMFFHPRNKNLAIGALIEAMLYIAQRTQSTGFKILKNLEEIADHCTICHRCFIKCPVNIDSGVISVQERTILKSMNFKHTPVATRMTLGYLGTKNGALNKVYRAGLLTAGGMAQRTGSVLAKPFTLMPALNRTRTMQLLRTPVAKTGVWTLRAHLPKAEKNQAILFEPGDDAVSTVFHFPGCGSERMFSKVSAASIFLLLSRGHRVVLPPPYLCCGYPLKVNARKTDFDRIFLENIIILTQIRDMFNDLEFKGCIVSCGTCMESLTDLGAGDIFDAEIKDIAGFLLADGLRPDSDESYLYHAPCHDSLKDKAVEMFSAAGMRVDAVPHCCSEAGTLAISRPDISNAMYDRKADAITEVNGKPPLGHKVLTNCPSCLQGLGRQKGVTPVHLAEELAELTGGKDWLTTFKEMTRNPEVVTF